MSDDLFPLTGQYLVRVISTHAFRAKDERCFFKIDLLVVDSSVEQRPQGTRLSVLLPGVREWGREALWHFFEVAFNAPRAEISGKDRRAAASTDEQPLQGAVLLLCARAAVSKTGKQYVECRWERVEPLPNERIPVHPAVARSRAAIAKQLSGHDGGPRDSPGPRYDPPPLMDATRAAPDASPAVSWTPLWSR